MPAPRPSDKKLLIDALADAYRTYDDLAVLFSAAFGRNLAIYAPPGPLLQVVKKVIDGVEAEGWIDELVVGAAEHNPCNPQLGRLVNLREGDT